MLRYFAIFIIFLVVISCNSTSQKRFVTKVTEEVGAEDSPKKRGQVGCRDKMNYAPDLDYLSHFPMRLLRVNFHIMRKNDGTGNFSEEAGRAYIHQVLNAANDKLSRNKQMRLPLGNNTPVLPMRYRYLLTPQPDDPDDDGIYFHNDDDLYFMVSRGRKRNNYDQKVYRKYGIQKDSVLNVFVMGFHTDSLKSKTYRPSSNGIAFGPWCKVASWQHHAKDTVWKRDGSFDVPKGKWYAQKLLNHEIGHCLGLGHTWKGNDGCDDTPKHTNCWGRSNKPPCNTHWGNNFMDYNTHASAWSPCQIAKIHYNFSTMQRRSTRNLLYPLWCKFKKDRTIKIRDEVEWLGSKDLEGHIIVENGGSLTIKCRISLPAKAKIIVKPKGKLTLDGCTLENACGQQWEGIEVWSNGNNKGKVVCRNQPEINNAINEIEVIR